MNTRPRRLTVRTCETCAKEFSIAVVDLQRGRGRFCSRQCSGAAHRSANNPNWHGGRYRATNGYIYVYAPDHPYATQDGYVMEHRRVVERRIGRFLLPEEEVHHRNAVRDDNRDENLELMPNKSAHRTHHGEFRDEPCACCGTAVARSAAHRRRYTRAFCSRRCAALEASRCASVR